MSISWPREMPRETRDTLFLLAVIASIVLPLAAHLPLWATAGSMALLAWRGHLAWRARALPRRWALVAILAILIAATLATHRTLVGRDAGVTLIAVLLALKTLEQHGRRDIMVVFFLGFFALLSNFFFSQALPVALAMAVALLGLLTALINAHMPVGRPPLTESLRLALRMALLGAPIMAVLFVFFPRFAPLWGLPTDALSGKTGLSGEMRVGAVAQLALDDSVAMRLRFLTPDKKPPAQHLLYFRGPVLEQFDGQQWLASIASGARWQHSTPAQLRVQGPPLRYEATVEPSARPWLALLDAVADAPQMPEGYRARMLDSLQWVSNRPITTVLRYEAQSHLQFEHGPLQRTASLASNTALPPGSNPRTRAWAQTLRQDPALASGGTQAFVDAALAQLRTGGYFYTLDPGVYGVHSADEFWFDRKEGFCEHIASSFVILMRALDIPARIVTGYQGGEINPIDGYWTVRNSDAHAWAEVWMAGRGWVRVDPTGAVSPARVGQLQRLRAPEGMLAGAVGAVLSPGVAQQMRALWEAMNNGWNQWVLNYTQGRQLDLLKNLGFEAPDWTHLLRLLVGFLSLGACAALGWMWYIRRRVNPWVRMLARARARLVDAGLNVPEYASPRAMAELVGAHWGQSPHPPQTQAQAQAICTWLLALEQARYAPAHTSTHTSTDTSAPSANTSANPQANSQTISSEPQRQRQLLRQWRRLRWPSSH